METLKHEKQWADWSTRFKGAIMTRGHPAARCALDAMEQAAEKDAGAPKCVDIAKLQQLDWSEEKLDNQKRRTWANDLYYILGDMTKGNAMVISPYTNGPRRATGCRTMIVTQLTLVIGACTDELKLI